MEILRYESDLLSSNMYVISEKGHAIIIDPYRNTDVVKDYIVDKIILTHEHYDHISGVNLFREITNAPVLCSKRCAENVKNPKKNMAAIFDIFCELQTWMRLETPPSADKNYHCYADETFTDRMAFRWNDHYLWLFELPGHSQGSIGILLDQKYFFSGDSLLEHDKTEQRLPGGSKKEWESISLPRIQLLKNGIQVYPGHGREFVLYR